MRMLWRVVRFLAGGAVGLVAGAAIATALSSERRQAVQERVRERWQRAREMAEAEAARTESELWARFRQLVGLSSSDGVAEDITTSPPGLR